MSGSQSHVAESVVLELRPRQRRTVLALSEQSGPDIAGAAPGPFRELCDCGGVGMLVSGVVYRF